MPDRRASGAIGVKGPIKKVVEYLRYPRLPRCRLECVVSIFEYDVSERAFWLLPDGLEDKQIRRQDGAVPCTVCDKQGHRALSNVVQRSTLEPERLPTAGREALVHQPVVCGVKHSDTVEGTLKTGPRSTI